MPFVTSTATGFRPQPFLRSSKRAIFQSISTALSHPSLQSLTI